MCQVIRAKVGRGASGKCWVEGKVNILFMLSFFRTFPLHLIVVWVFSFSLSNSSCMNDL